MSSSGNPGVQQFGAITPGDVATWKAAGLIQDGGGGGGGVSQIIAGTNITISPPGGTGAVTINASSTASTAFSALTSSTNTTAAMVIGTGASLAATGSGTITATAAPISGVTGLGTGIATFLATPSSANLAAAITDETGSGSIVFATSPTLVTPALGTPASGVLTNCTGTASGLTAGTVSTISGLIAQGTNVTITGSGTSGSPYTIAASGGGSSAFNTLTSGTNTTAAMVVGSGASLAVTGSGTIAATTVVTNANLTGAVTSSGNATSLGSFSSANLASALTDKTGTGVAVFATSPTLVTPVLGTPTSGTLTNCTGLPEGGLSLTNITTNNVSTSKHGFAPILPNDATKYLDGTGAYSVPAGGGGGSSNGNNITVYSDNGLTLTAGTRYASIGGGGVPSATEADVGVAAPSATTMLNLQVNLSVAPGTGQTLAVTLRKNGADTALTCTISNSAVTGQDLTHTVSIAQNDVIDWKIVTTGTYIATPTVTITAGVGGAVSSGTQYQAAYYSATGATVSGSLFSIDAHGHLISNSDGTTTITAGAGAGTGPTISITGNDVAGVINLTTGSTPAAGVSTIATITFANAYGSAPKLVLVSNTGATQSTRNPYVSSISTSGWVLSAPTSLTLTASTTYVIYYLVIG